MSGGPYGSVMADTMRVAVTALLLVRGCPADRVAEAIEWLGARRIPQGITELIEAGVLQHVADEIDPATRRTVRVVAIAPRSARVDQLELQGVA